MAHHLKTPEAPGEDYVVLPKASHDFILQALRETTQALSRHDRLRATRHILVEEGIRLTQANSFQIDHRDQLLLMNLAAGILRRSRSL